jgi:ADP-heptose:LPS heptosyltransferase
MNDLTKRGAGRDRSSEFLSDTLDAFGAFQAGGFRECERLVSALERYGITTSGFPRIRPADCARVIDAIEEVFLANLPEFRVGDKAVIDRFEQVLETFAKTDVRHYPNQWLRVRVLQAEACMALGNPGGARDLIGAYADRPHKIEGRRETFLEVMTLDCKARVGRGEVADLGQIALERARLLSRMWPLYSVHTAYYFVDFIAMGRRKGATDDWLARLTRAFAGSASRHRVSGGSIGRYLRSKWGAWAGIVATAFLLNLHGLGMSLFGRKARNADELVVARAMGGVGDLIMMTPGLRSLSERFGAPIKLVTDRKFFDIFRGNPHVELIDIDGPLLPVMALPEWRNLTRCPAGAYESRNRPRVKLGRVELFARGMGVRKKELQRTGLELDYYLDDGQTAFIEAFLARMQRRGKPLIGVQPYSRERYKDHPEILTLIDRLRADYDLIVFHHVDVAVEDGPGVATTAGLSLAHSIALCSAVQAMVCVDSGFLHLAAAFHVPIVALFGPTDGELFTRHHRYATVLQERERFPCSPCWRNEDLPCHITGEVGLSPCMGAIAIDSVRDALKAALAKARDAAPTQQEGA